MDALAHLFSAFAQAAPATDIVTETRDDLRFLSAPDAWVVVLVIIPAIAFAVWSVYRRERGRSTPRVRAVLGALRACTLLTLVAILFQPVLVSTVVRVIKPRLVLLVDDSASMQENDPYADGDERARLAETTGLQPDEVAAKSRTELVRAVLEHGETPLIERLRESFDTRVYGFDTAVRRNVALGDLGGRGASTRLGQAIDTVYGELIGTPAAGVVVLSDGRSNEGADPVRAVRRLSEMQQLTAPLLSVAVGDPTPRREIEVRILKPKTGQEFLVGDQIPFTIEVNASGFGPGALPLEIEILEEGDRVTSQTISIDGAGATHKEVVFVRAEHDGRRTFTVRVPPAPEETNKENNEQSVAVRVTKKRIKVLYVEGSPRWEYRFLKNALVRDDENFAVRIMLLSAERDFVQEASPDLDPVFVFPSEPKELFDYHVIVLGDIDPDALADTPEEVTDRLKLIERFVADTRGGLLFLASEAHNPHAFVSTPLEKVLPVVPGSRGAFGTDFERPFRPRRTALGLDDPLLLFSKDFAQNQRLWEDPTDGFPPLFWYAPVERAKPGARVLLTHPTARNRFGPVPLLVTQFFGDGRTMFLGIDSLWRWRRFYGDRYFYQLYSQAIRYLATSKLYSGNRRYDLFTDKQTYDVGDTIRVSAAVRDADFNPAKAERQTVYWQPPRATRPKRLELTKVKDGEYETVIAATDRGRHTMWITESGERDDRADEYSFDVDITPVEKAEPSTNAPLMQQLASVAGDASHYLLLHDLADAIDERLDSEPQQIPDETKSRDLWDRWWLLVLITALLAVEWIVRRRFRLQ